MKTPRSSVPRSALKTALRNARCAHVSAIRLVISSREVQCDPSCQGWFVDSETGAATRCDSCARLGVYHDAVDDSDIAILPEAQRAQRAWHRTHKES